jgi:NAD(P)-dependent dehydrogenase (short-subunit alcohol dehydrogenase family)
MDGNDEDRVLAVEQRATVRYLTLDCPDVLNALNARGFSELEAQISAVAADPGIRAVVIAGAGDRAFSAGADLDELTGLILKSMGSNAGLDAGLAHETTLRGTFLCMRAAGRHFAERGMSKVINVCSNLAFKARPRFSAYSASKAAISVLTRTAAVEWAKFGAQVNAIAPGYVETDMNAELRRDKELYTRVVNQIPAKRMARAEEIGPLAVYLASPASDFMTGETIVIDGGETAR